MSDGNNWQQLTLFVADTHANPSASQAQETAQTTNATYGPISPTPFAFFDPDLLCWKTSQGTLILDLETSKPIWPRAGMTHNGTAYQRQPSAPLTAVTEYSLLLHDNMEWTPTATANQMAPSMLARNPGLRLWPTPTAHLAKENGSPSEGLRNEPTLTFQALNGKPGKLNPEWVEWLMGFPTGWTDLED
jgi:hypothetical protein